MGNCCYAGSRSGSDNLYSYSRTRHQQHKTPISDRSSNKTQRVRRKGRTRWVSVLPSFLPPLPAAKGHGVVTGPGGQLIFQEDIQAALDGGSGNREVRVQGVSVLAADAPS